MTARSPDALIEATEKPDARFFLTVQWHPEITAADDPRQQALFGWLVEAARRYQERREPDAAAE